MFPCQNPGNVLFTRILSHLRDSISLSFHSIFAHFTFPCNLLLYVHFLHVRLGTLPGQGNIFNSPLSLSPQLQAKESTHHRVPKYVLNSIDIVNRMLGQRMNLYIGCFSFSSKRDDRNAIDHLKKTKFPWSLWKEGWGGFAGRIPFGDIWDYCLEESR